MKSNLILFKKRILTYFVGNLLLHYQTNKQKKPPAILYNGKHWLTTNSYPFSDEILSISLIYLIIDLNIKFPIKINSNLAVNMPKIVPKVQLDNYLKHSSTVEYSPQRKIRTCISIIRAIFFTGSFIRRLCCSCGNIQ